MNQRKRNKKIPFRIAQGNEEPQSELTKEVEDPYSENCKTPLKEGKEATKKWNEINCS